MKPGLERSSHAAYAVLGKAVAKLMPDRIPVTFVGDDAVGELCRSIGYRGIRKVLVVSDAGLVGVGIVDRITEQLEAAGVDWALYAGVEPDPTFAQVEAGFRQYEAEGCDAVVALGGGSPMDASKMVAAMATNGGKLAALEGKFKVKQPPAPLFAVPTTAGTGSEVTVAAVVSDTETHEKKFFLDPKLLPEMVALDAGLMTGLPAPMTAATGMDALTHAVEAFIAKTATAKTDGYAEIAVRLVFQHLPTAYRDGGDLDARKAMALAAYYAGLAFTRTSVGYVHAIAHNLGATYGTPHGLANAIALPLVLDFSKEAARPRLARLAEIIGVESGSETEKVQRFIAAVRELMESVGIGEQLEALKEEDIESLATRARAEAYLEYPVPRYMDQEECEALLRRMLVDNAA